MFSKKKKKFNSFSIIEGVADIKIFLIVGFLISLSKRERNNSNKKITVILKKS